MLTKTKLGSQGLIPLLHTIINGAGISQRAMKTLPLYEIHLIYKIIFIFNDYLDMSTKGSVQTMLFLDKLILLGAILWFVDPQRIRDIGVQSSLI